MKLKRFEELNEGIKEGKEKTNTKNVTSKRPKALPAPQSSPKNDNSLNTREIWVVFKYGDYDIDKVYLNKADAEKAAELETKTYYDYYRGINKNMTDKEYDDYHKQAHKNRTWKATSLYDAIDMIKEEVRDSNSGWDDEDY